MATEVELKAWVRDVAAMRLLLDRICIFEYEYTKKDIYLHGPGGRPEESWAHWNGEPGVAAGADGTAAQMQESGAIPIPFHARDFRLRIEEGGATCTFKDRRLDRGVEVNREVEFSVSDAPAFLELARRIGCAVFSCKVKRGRRYRYERDARYAERLPLVIEMSAIAGLGVFIEVECVVNDPALREAAAREIRLFAANAGIGEDDIEPTPYAKLLSDRGVNQCSEIAELTGGW